MRRTAFTILETAVAAVVLGVLATLVVQSLMGTAMHRAAVQERQLALQVGASAMEEITLLPWDELTTDRANELLPHSDSTRPLSRAVWSVTVDDEGIDDEETEPRAKRVQLQVQLMDRAGQKIAPLLLTAWVFQREVQP